MSVTVDVTKKQGSTMGTVIAKVTDPTFAVRDVNFYVRVPGRSPELGPYPPDVARRPSPGVYEKDVVLDPEFETVVRTEVIQDDGTPVAGAEQTFGPRALTAAGAGDVRVQDADTPATVAGTLAFQGMVVSVADRVATFDFDGRYLTHDGARIALAGYYTKTESDDRYPLAAHTHPYLPLAGGTITGDLALGGVLYGDRTLSWANDIPDGGAHLFLRSAADPRKRLAAGYSDGGAGTGFGFLAAGQLGVQWAPLALQPSGGHVGIGTGSPASALHLQGDRHATFGPNSAYGAYLKVGSGSRPDAAASIFATNGNLHLDSQNGGYHLILNYYNTSGNVIVGATAAAPYKLSVYGDAYVSGGWVRVAGDQGLYFESWGGGFHMTDSSTIQTTNGKNLSLGGAHMFAGIYYDGNDPAYYGDFAGSSRVNVVEANALYANRAGSGSGGGVMLHGNDLNSYFVAMRGTGWGGTHGYVTGDWATYLSTDGTANRGWVFRNSWVGNVASISNGGAAWFNGRVRTNEWFRNSNPGEGLYNEHSGIHWYAGSDGYNGVWNGTGYGICLRSSHANGSTAYASGWLFRDDGGNFGLLHSGRNWAVRSWNGGTMLYGDVQVETHLNLTDGNPSHLGTSKRIYFGSTNNAYAIFKSASWPSSGGGYSRLVINYHTGIILGAQQQYGGIQFFATELGAGGAKLFSIGEGDGNVRVANVLYAATVRATDRMNTANGYTVNDNTRYFDNGLTFGWGGGWFMEDSTWMRTVASKSVWLGSGWYGTNGGITLGRGGATDGSFRLDSQGRIRTTSQSQGAAYSSAAIEVREYNFTGWTGDGNWYNAPRIALHWAGVVASQIGLASNGRIHILNNPGNANEDLQARDYYNGRGHTMAASLSGSGNPTMAANAGSLYIQY